MMKKTLTTMAVALLSVTMLFAGVRSENRQEIIPVGSEIYEALKSLYIAEGLALPSTTGPWNAAELDMIAERLDRSMLSEDEKSTYDWTVSALSEDAVIETDGDFGLNTGFTVAAAMYAHTDPERFPDLDSFDGTGDIRPQVPLLTIPLETWIGRHVWGFSSFDLGIGRTLANSLEESRFFTNIIMVPPSQMSDLDLNFPSRAVGSFGGERWNIAIGKDRMSWGPGESGNLIIGEQLPYHNSARFTAFANRFKYTFAVSSFIHPRNYMKDDGTGKYWFDPLYDMRPERKGISMLISHRLEWRIIDKINMALTESIRYQSSDGSIDLIVLSPTAVFHNYYIRGNANSIISLELDYAPVKHLDLYGEMCVDEFRLPGEFDVTNPGPPTALGYMLGAKTAWQLGDGMLSAYVEGAYTDPYLYLRDEGRSYGSDKYGINFIAGLSEWVSADGRPNYTQEFIGYRYGNDSIVAEVGVDYRVWDRWHVEGRYTYLQDGCFDENTRWAEVVPNSEDDPAAGTESHPSQGSFDRNYVEGSRNAAAHCNVLSLKAGITLFDSFDIWGEFNYVNILNFRNVKGAKADDMQFVLGLSYTL